jgi:hypothetical protein
LKFLKQLRRIIEEQKSAIANGALQFGMTLVHVGTLCLARIADKIARVKILQPAGKSAFCFLIDSGERLMIPLADLAVLPSKCRMLAPQVIGKICSFYLQIC